ncbi:twin-arginine translocation signal domain-containing protein [Thermodesulfobacteriota bacterium]
MKKISRRTFLKTSAATLLFIRLNV